MRLKLASVLLVGLVAIAAGCGGSEKTAATTGADTTTQATTTEDTTAQTTATETETTAAETTAPSFASSSNCLKLLNLSASFAQAFAASGGDNDLEDVAKFFDEFADQAPEEIRSDFQVIAKAFSAYVKALAEANLKPGEQPTAEQLQALQNVGESFNEAEVTKASANIDAWAKKNCPS